MSFLLVLAAVSAAGVVLVRLARLGSGHAAADVALGFLAGSGAVACALPLLRFGAGIPARPALALVAALAAAASWALRRRGPGHAAARLAPRWVPRPAWLFAPAVLYVAVVAGAVLLHGFATPTHADDGLRVRAFAPLLAVGDAWPDAARAVFVMAGPVPTFLPALAGIATGTADHFHANYAVLAELVALLVLVVVVGASRGSPERGWGGAAALLSIPLFVYHATSALGDAVLAMRVAAGLLFAIEYSRTGDRRDAAVALLLYGLAALVKREGELVAAAPAALLVAQLARETRRGRAFPWRAVAGFALPVTLGAAAKIAAVGVGEAFPMLVFAGERAAQAAAAPLAVGGEGTPAFAARVLVERALLRSGNAGMIFWVLGAVVLVRARALARSPLAWPLAALAALLAEVAVNSVLLMPEYTIDQTTVHRALLVVSVPAALWIVAALEEAVGARAAGSPVAAAGADGRSLDAVAEVQ